MTFHVNSRAPYSPEHKGRWSARYAHPAGRLRCLSVGTIRELQQSTDHTVDQSARWRCPATGSRVWEAWQDERSHLAPLAPPDATVRSHGALCGARRRVGERRRTSVVGSFWSTGRDLRGRRRPADPRRAVNHHQCIRATPIGNGVNRSGARRRLEQRTDPGAHALRSARSAAQELAAVPVKRPIDFYAAPRSWPDARQAQTRYR